MRPVSTFLFSLLVLGSSACLNGLGENDGSDGGPREGYPSGPYGVAEGDVIEDLGFVDPDGNPFSLSEVYADGANKLILASTAAGWCVACAEEQPDLQVLHERHGSEGLFVLVAVFEDASYQPAQPSDAAMWQSQYSVDFKVVADQAFVFDAYYDSSLTPMNMLIDVDTMSIIRVNTGWDPTVMESLIEAKL